MQPAVSAAPAVAINPPASMPNLSGDVANTTQSANRASPLNTATVSYQKPTVSRPPIDKREERSNTRAAAGAPNSRGRNGFGSTDFSTSNFSGPRVLAAEELFDIQEQADFFLSLDQPDQAIEVLKNHITENVETSALAYMDLFDIYHRTKRVTEYAQLREEFNHVFNAQVPEFRYYGAPSGGLEDVPEVLKNIQDAWSMPLQAQDVIEESIFRQPGQDHKPMDMIAYRELMLLYSLAKELGRPNAKYSMLPMSMQTVAIPKLTGSPESSGFFLGEDFVFEDAQSSALPADASTQASHRATPETTGQASQKQESSSDTVDFDLSDSELSSYKLPNSGKKT
jgi:hypothetical protein